MARSKTVSHYVRDADSAMGSYQGRGGRRRGQRRRRRTKRKGKGRGKRRRGRGSGALAVALCTGLKPKDIKAAVEGVLKVAVYHVKKSG